MARFSGIVGYVIQEKTAPGVWTPKETERKMRGSIINQSAHNRSTEQISDDISLNHRVSVLGDAYAFDNYYHIKWVKIDGIKWKVTSVEVKRPRLLLAVGGMWNG